MRCRGSWLYEAPNVVYFDDPFHCPGPSAYPGYPRTGLKSLNHRQLEAAPCKWDVPTPNSPLLIAFFTKSSERDHDARFVNSIDSGMPRASARFDTRRHVDFANAASNSLEKLAQACEPASFGLNNEDVFRRDTSQGRKDGLGHFLHVAVPEQTDRSM
jgi:hypothetical protein